MGTPIPISIQSALIGPSGYLMGAGKDHTEREHELKGHVGWFQGKLREVSLGYDQDMFCMYLCSYFLYTFRIRAIKVSLIMTLYTTSHPIFLSKIASR